MELTIIEEDRVNALRDWAAGKLLLESCMVFHAAKRTGINPVEVSLYHIGTEDYKSFDLDQEGKRITGLGRSEWKDVVLPLIINLEERKESPQ